jgi:hypothetical protein
MGGSVVAVGKVPVVRGEDKTNSLETTAGTVDGCAMNGSKSDVSTMSYGCVLGQ